MDLHRFSKGLAVLTRMPRELDPEWYWRARLWAAAWKVPILFAIGVLYGAAWFYFTWDGEPTVLVRIVFVAFGALIAGIVVLILRDHYSE